MFDFGYDFLQGLQQIEIYKGASGAIFSPAAIGGAINFITDIDYENYFSFSGSGKRTNSLDANFLTLLIQVGIIILKLDHTNRRT